ncbi:MAG TPA: nitrilase-related carbon-nitrogen hydrolase [Gemmatimonadales bacterium]|nr:nitrilase-related carbon-nitrogen hydrolase [Gemmatimonadales bacterium]
MRPARQDIPAIVASAVLLNLAYPPFHLILPAALCLAPVLVALERCNEGRSPARRQMLLGFWFGALGNAVLLHWMAAALWQYRQWAIVVFAAGILWLAALTGVAFAAVGWIRRRTGAPAWIVFPAVWTALEWLLAHQGRAAFAWLGLGTTLTGYPVLVQIADVVGARGVGFLLAAGNAALAAAWIHRHEWRRAALRMAFVATGWLAALLYGVFRIHHLDQRELDRVAVVQTDIAPQDKWNRSGSAVDQVLELSRIAAAHGPDLILWPETALPGALLYHPEWERSVGRLARSASTFILAGGIHAIPRERELDQFNAAFLFGPGGERMGPPYQRQHLVPLFEWGNGIKAGETSTILPLRHGLIGVLICGEATYESLARAHRRKGAGALVNLSNDAWFAAGTGAHQQAAHVIMRAIETRAGVARAANRGISEIVDPAGRVRQRVPGDGSGIAVGYLATTEAIPLYVRLGDWVGLLSVGAAGAFLALSAAVMLRASALCRGAKPRSSRVDGGMPHGRRIGC